MYKVDPLSVPCSRCRAGVGRKCHDQNLLEDEVHPTRLRHASAKIPEEVKLDILNVVCPTCNAQPGKECTRTGAWKHGNGKPMICPWHDKRAFGFLAHVTEAMAALKKKEALRVTRFEALQIKCPKCKAPVGEPCIGNDFTFYGRNKSGNPMIHKNGKKPLKRLHGERWDDAVATFRQDILSEPEIQEYLAERKRKRDAQPQKPKPRTEDRLDKLEQMMAQILEKLNV